MSPQHGRSRSPQWQQAPAAGALLLVALTNVSLLGFAFLAAFLAWGFYCLPEAAQPGWRHQAAAAAGSKRIWAAVSGKGPGTLRYPLLSFLPVSLLGG